MITLLRNVHVLQSARSITANIKPYSKKACERKTYSKRIFSGIQPTGNVHLGNYLGAIKEWVKLQDSGEEVFWSIVDMHSITLPHNPKELNENILKMTATLIACGIDPRKSTLFQQSTVSMHAELSWVLGCITTSARLAHLPQYKEKSQELKNIPLGLYIYPVLQAADILLYRATHVPVGQDQVQHIHLAQDLAIMFNKKFGDTFPVPHSLINDGPGQRIKSLRDPSKKMSKSHADEKSKIDIMEEPDVLLRNIKKAVTDFTSEVTYEPETRPGISNLINIHSLLTGKAPSEICREAQGLDTGQYKLILADVIIEKLTPIREEYFRLMKESTYLEEVLRGGMEKATEIAIDCWLDVRNTIGFGNNALITNKGHLRNVANKI